MYNSTTPRTDRFQCNVCLRTEDVPMRWLGNVEGVDWYGATPPDGWVRREISFLDILLGSRPYVIETDWLCDYCVGNGAK